MKRIYSEVDNQTHARYKAFLEMNDLRMIDHIRTRVMLDIIEWENEHPEEVEYYKQIKEIEAKLEKLRAP